MDNKNIETIKFAGPNGPTEEVPTGLQKPVEAPIHPSKMEFNPKLKTALFVLRDKGGCGFYRCVQPATFLRQRGLMNTIVDFKTTTREHILQSDIIILQESGSPASLEAMNFALQQGKPVVIENDDFLHKVSPHNEGGYGTWNPGTLFIHRFSTQMMNADALTVSSNQLAREYLPYNPTIYVLPNFLNEDKWSIPQTKKEDGYLRIGWAGGNAHLDDLKMISKVIEKIIRENKGKVKFETMGMVKKELKGCFDSMEEFNDICPHCGYQGDKVTWMGESLDNYPTVLASHGWDIALAPVINESFGNCKSNIKLKEYSAIGFPIVASDVVPYRESLEDGCDVLLSRNFEEWYNNINELLKNPERRKEIVENNKKWVANHWISDNVKLYFDVYSQIIDKKAKKLNK